MPVISLDGASKLHLGDTAIMFERWVKWILFSFCWGGKNSFQLQEKCRLYINSCSHSWPDENNNKNKWFENLRNEKRENTKQKISCSINQFLRWQPPKSNQRATSKKRLTMKYNRLQKSGTFYFEDILESRPLLPLLGPFQAPPRTSMYFSCLFHHFTAINLNHYFFFTFKKCF